MSIPAFHKIEIKSYNFQYYCPKMWSDDNDGRAMNHVGGSDNLSPGEPESG